MLGSPPHAWGIHTRNNKQINKQRLTPTCVGNTRSCKDRPEHRGAHPHMRGEYLSERSLMVLSTGSPPHAWGIRPPLCRVCVYIRLTPTCVGNTYEKLSIYLKRQGSPPHAWGIHLNKAQVSSFCRLTPTCVGNTRAHLKQT